ncbi:MAG: hypothetical protein GXW89_08135 [Phycisphaerae bacterium]|jgi:hypothetical protein|nr:hypothetical protein [Phycisphaerae bacterium]HXK86226.1 hypothetical protein [Phycisphaerae bacterium]
MPIRFTCPSCQQPLEIDDTWGGQSVACPYCRRVITAPSSSTWPTGEVPMASPAGVGSGPTEPPASAASPPPFQGFAPPPPPPGYASRSEYRPPQSGLAGWALTLAIAGALLSGLATLLWLGMAGNLVMQKAGPNPTQEETSRIMREMLEQGQAPRHPVLSGAVLIATLSSLAGLILGIRSLARQEPGRGLAITACVLGAMFLVCQTMLMLLVLAAHGPGGA